MAAGVGNLIGVPVQSLAILVLRTGLIVGKHAYTVFHGEDFIVDAAVVAILIAQIVKPLAQLSNQLVFLRRSNLDSTCLYRKIRKWVRENSNKEKRVSAALHRF